MPKEQPEIRNILFATDFSHLSEAAIPYVDYIARHFGSAVTVAHVVPPSAYAPLALEAGPLMFETILEAERQCLATFVETSALARLPHKAILLEGDIAEMLAATVHEHEIDLLILGSHGRAGLNRLIVGSIAERILKQAPCPVLIVGPHAIHRLPAGARLHRILCATDFRQESLPALDLSLRLARASHSRLTLLAVLANDDSHLRQTLTSATLCRMRQLLPAASDSHLLVDFGAPPEVICERAQEGCDLIVLGGRTPARPTHNGHKFGTVTRKVVATAPCPVLSVPESWTARNQAPDVIRVTPASAA